MNCLPNDRNLADNKSSVAEMIIPRSSRVENIVENGENTGYQDFLLFPECFQKAFSSGC